MTTPGKYIVIEGVDGTGKSTQVGLLREALKKQGIESDEHHEPDGTPIANEIRAIIKNGSLTRDAATNLLLFTAARHEIWQRAQQRLDDGVWVIAARNYFSTLAYQGYGEGLSLDLIYKTTRQFTDERYMRPDLAVILTLDDEAERAHRIATRGRLTTPDTFESRDGYLDIAAQNDLPILSAARPAPEMTRRILALLDKNNKKR
jgi:dTMP kinase